jgi:hypothetical protein
MLKKISIGAMLATIAVPGDASAQQPPAITQQTATIKRTPLLHKRTAESSQRKRSAESRQTKTASITGRITTSV